MILLERDFYDYKTGDVNGTDVVDMNKTGMSFYDDFLSNDLSKLEYLKNSKNLVGEVVWMTPQEYFQQCAEYAFSNHPSVETLKKQRYADKNTLNHLKDVLTVAKKKFPMPMLNKAHEGQEGLHRMIVIGDMFGWNLKVPVLVVDWADKQRAYENKKIERRQRIAYNIKMAVLETLRYKFSNIDELKDQLQWELDRKFEYNPDEIETPVQFELTSDEPNKEFTVSIGAANYSFNYDDIQFIDSEEDDLDIDDLEIDDFLVRYFGDDWRETFPHLKDKFNIKD